MIFNGKIIDKDSTLSSTNICPDSSIYLTPRMRGGT
jgi:hypothetical protein